jgi:dCMP deaminase
MLTKQIILDLQLRVGIFSMIDKWDVRFMEMAKEIAGWSKDPSKKIGCVAVGDNHRVLSTGYNGFPRGISDDEERYDDREQKYKYVVHAEKNCIYNACMNGISLAGAKLYVCGLPICSECAKGIIQVGIKEVIIEGECFDVPKWNESFKLSEQLFDEAGIVIKYVDIRKPMDAERKTPGVSRY